MGHGDTNDPQQAVFVFAHSGEYSMLLKQREHRTSSSLYSSSNQIFFFGRREKGGLGMGVVWSSIQHHLINLIIVESLHLFFYLSLWILSTIHRDIMGSQIILFYTCVFY